MQQDVTDGVTAPLGSFLDALASSGPTPGGGAAAAVAGSMAAALVSMVCNLTIGRPRYAAVEAAMQHIRSESEAARHRLLALADEDAAAYAAVAAALRLPRADEAARAARTAALQRALEAAAGPPLETMRLARSLVPLALQVAAHGNANVVSDAGVAAELGAAAVRGSALNVRVNLAELRNAAFVAQAEAEIAAAEVGLADDLARVVAIVRANLAPKATA
jgi:formiminotetrahydrofolate cyclodeaminase